MPAACPNPLETVAVESPTTDACENHSRPSPATTEGRDRSSQHYSFAPPEAPRPWIGGSPFSSHCSTAPPALAAALSSKWRETRAHPTSLAFLQTQYAKKVGAPLTGPAGNAFHEAHFISCALPVPVGPVKKRAGPRRRQAWVLLGGHP